jgi:hypothetical protein
MPGESVRHRQHPLSFVSGRQGARDRAPICGAYCMPEGNHGWCTFARIVPVHLCSGRDRAYTVPARIYTHPPARATEPRAPRSGPTSTKAPLPISRIPPVSLAIGYSHTEPRRCRCGSESPPSVMSAPGQVDQRPLGPKGWPPHNPLACTWPFGLAPLSPRPR